MSSGEIVTKYNECINQRDIKGLEGLIDDDYVFIDTAGTEIQGKQNGIAVWKDFFEQFPDYKNEFEHIEQLDDGSVVITGKSICSFKPLEGPALWRAQLKDEKILKWQVYDDSKDNRRQLGIS